MLFHIRSGLGDDVALTALVREAKRQFPGEIIEVDSKHPEVFLGNPYMGKGSEKKLGTILLRPHFLPYEEMGNLPYSYGIQAGVRMVDTRPEVWLTDEEYLKASFLLGDEIMKQHGKVGTEGVVALDTWATWRSRQWPFERWTELAATLRERGWTVVEVGATVPDNRGDVRNGRIRSDVSLVDRLGVRETAAVLQVAGLYIGNDSGNLHLAAAVGTPQVGIFSVKKWWARAYWNTVPVYSMKPCNSECFMECTRKDPCLLDVSVEDVLRAVDLAASRFIRHDSLALHAPPEGFRPVEIKGEPLSETLKRERR